MIPYPFAVFTADGGLLDETGDEGGREESGGVVHVCSAYVRNTLGHASVTSTCADETVPFCMIPQSKTKTAAFASNAALHGQPRCL